MPQWKRRGQIRINKALNILKLDTFALHNYQKSPYVLRYKSPEEMISLGFSDTKDSLQNRK